MKKRYGFLFFLLFIITGHGIAQKIQPADTLHDAFLIRPLSIVKEEPRWNRASTDLFTAWLSSGLYGLYGPQPQIMLNGIPFNANFFGWQSLNALPVFVQNIDKAASQFAPGVYRHVATGAGLINFKSEPLKRGFTAQAFYYSGNETKDPGPWAYDSLKISPNIDRWGPDRGIFLAYKAQAWYAKGVYLRRFHKPKDLAQNLRLHITNALLDDITEYVNYPINIKSRNGLFEAGIATSHLNFKTRLTLSESKDFLFLQSFGRELPVETKYRQFAIQGKYSNGRWSLKARYLFDYKSINKREEQHFYIFDWKQLIHSISLSGKYETGGFSVTPGAIFKQINTDAPGLTSPRDNLLTLFLKGDLRVNSHFRLYLNNYLDFHKNIQSLAGSFRFGAAIQLTKGWQVNPEVYYSETLPIRQHSFAYWVKRGYTFAERLGISFDNPVNVLENEVLSLKLSNLFSFGDFTFQFVPRFIKNYRLNIPWQVVTYYEFTHTLPGNFTVSQHPGSRLKWLFYLDHSYSSLFQQSLTLYLQNIIDGSERYRNYFKQIPDTKIKYQFDITPVRGLQISLNAIYRSSTEWVEFRALEGKEYRLPIGIPIRPFTRTFHTTVPSYINIGLSVRKWFADRRISLQLGLQNILDQEVRLHPIGASLYPKANFKLSLRF